MSVRIDRSSREWLGYAKALIHDGPDTEDHGVYAALIVARADALYTARGHADVQDEERREREYSEKIEKLKADWPDETKVRVRQNYAYVREGQEGVVLGRSENDVVVLIDDTTRHYIDPKYLERM